MGLAPWPCSSPMSTFKVNHSRSECLSVLRRRKKNNGEVVRITSEGGFPKGMFDRSQSRFSGSVAFPLSSGLIMCCRFSKRVSYETQKK